MQETSRGVARVEVKGRTRDRPEKRRDGRKERGGQVELERGERRGEGPCNGRILPGFAYHFINSEQCTRPASMCLWSHRCATIVGICKSYPKTYGYCEHAEAAIDFESLFSLDHQFPFSGAVGGS